MLDSQHIKELKYPIGNGATNPIIGMISTGHCVVKTNNNIEGNKTLVNEYICYLLALQLELPVINSGLCYIDNDTIICQNVKDMEDFSEKCFGLGFYSEYMDGATVIGSEKMIKLTENYKWLIPKLMLFDHLIYNKDRNKGNLLIKLGKNNRKLLVIDHSHTFNLETLWDRIQLKSKIQEKDYLDEYIMEKNAYIYSRLKKSMELDLIIMQDTLDYFKSKLNEKIISDIINKVPEEWESNKEELLALKEYIIYRFSKLNHFADIILNYKY